MVGGLRDIITCAEFQIEIFMGYDFTGGRIFDFPIDFSLGLTTVQRYCAACDIAVKSQLNSIITCRINGDRPSQWQIANSPPPLQKATL